jgi:hypothetical protein
VTTPKNFDKDLAFELLQEIDVRMEQYLKMTGRTASDDREVLAIVREVEETGELMLPIWQVMFQLFDKMQQWYGPQPGQDMDEAWTRFENDVKSMLEDLDLKVEDTDG